jgi:hypothetical protein
MMNYNFVVNLGDTAGVLWPSESSLVEALLGTSQDFALFYTNGEMKRLTTRRL